MMTWFSNLHIVLQALIAASTVAASLYAVWRNVIRPARDFLRSLRTMVRSVEEIRSYVGPNGGRSLFDRVNDQGRLQRLHDARLSTVLDVVVDDAMFQTDADGRWTWANSALEKIFETPSDHTVGKGWINLLLPEDRDRAIREWEHAVRDQRDFMTMTRMVTQLRGVELKVRWKAQPIVDELEKKVIAWIGTLKPVSVHDPAEAA